MDPTGDWGDIHGDTCECDERNCKAVYDRYSDDFCSGKKNVSYLMCSFITKVSNQSNFASILILPGLKYIRL